VADRVSAATRAYSEWMPIRDGDTPTKIFRSFAFGDLVHIAMCDTRLWGRDEPIETSGFGSVPYQDDQRSLLGDDQEAWLEQQLTSSARWKLIGQQVMVGHLKTNGLPNADGGGTFFNVDQWDGYKTARDRLFSILKESAGNAVVLTGDIHSSWPTT
jgi:alkaline phosphatase D